MTYLISHWKIRFSPLEPQFFVCGKCWRVISDNLRLVNQTARRIAEEEVNFSDEFILVDYWNSHGGAYTTQFLGLDRLEETVSEDGFLFSTTSPLDFHKEYEKNKTVKRRMYLGDGVLIFGKEDRISEPRYGGKYIFFAEEAVLQRFTMTIPKNSGYSEVLDRSLRSKIYSLAEKYGFEAKNSKVIIFLSDFNYPSKDYYTIILFRSGEFPHKNIVFYNKPCIHCKRVELYELARGLDGWMKIEWSEALLKKIAGEDVDDAMGTLELTEVAKGEIAHLFPLKGKRIHSWNSISLGSYKISANADFNLLLHSRRWENNKFREYVLIEVESQRTLIIKHPKYGVAKVPVGDRNGKKYYILKWTLYAGEENA